jgi:hypothetical protein
MRSTSGVAAGALARRSCAAFVVLLLTGSAVFAAPQAAPYPCTLSPDLLRPYHEGGATANDFAAVRRALWPFIEHCPGGPADHASRKVLFDIIAEEFGMGADISREFDPADDRDRSEARDEGIRYTRRDLRVYLDAIVTPADVEFKKTIISYGRPLAISKLGPAVKDDVIRNATTPTGVVYAYMQATAQQELWARWATGLTRQVRISRPPTRRDLRRFCSRISITCRRTVLPSPTNHSCSK